MPAQTTWGADALHCGMNEGNILPYLILSKTKKKTAFFASVCNKFGLDTLGSDLCEGIAFLP